MTVPRTAARRARLKLLGSIATTHGYAILGVAIVQPLISGLFNLSLFQIGGTLLGLAAQAFAIYIAPYGETT